MHKLAHVPAQSLPAKLELLERAGYRAGWERRRTVPSLSNSVDHIHVLTFLWRFLRFQNINKPRWPFKLVCSSRSAQIFIRINKEKCFVCSKCPATCCAGHKPFNPAFRAKGEMRMTHVMFLLRCLITPHPVDSGKIYWGHGDTGFTLCLLI